MLYLKCVRPKPLCVQQQQTCKKRHASIYNQQLKSFFFFIFMSNFHLFLPESFNPAKITTTKSLWFLNEFVQKFSLYCGFWWQLDTHKQKHIHSTIWKGQDKVLCTLKKRRYCTYWKITLAFGLTLLWLSCMRMRLFFSISPFFLLSDLLMMLID